LPNLRLDNGIGAAILPHPVRDHDKPQFRFFHLFAYRLEDALGKHAYGTVHALVRLIEIEKFIDLGIRYGQRQDGPDVPLRTEHGLQAGKRGTTQERSRVKNRTLYAFHPPLKTFNPGFSADYSSLDSVGLAFVKRPKEGQAVARVLNRLIVPEQQARFGNMDELFHSTPPSGASSKASSSWESLP
jgi:hypothetical protein